MANNPGKAATDVPFSPGAFTEGMEQAKSVAEEFRRAFAGMKFPGAPDMEALLEAHRRNMEALSAANRVAMEGAQAVARRHFEIMQQSMTELGETMRALTAPGEPAQAKAAKQAELLKQGYERAVANTRELAELIRRSNGEALEVLNKRFAEALDEVKTLVEKAGSAKG